MHNVERAYGGAKEQYAEFGVDTDAALAALKQFSPTQSAGISSNWAAGLTWFVTLALCVGLNYFANVQIFFLSLPGWFIAAMLYIVFSKIFQKSIAQEGAAS